MKALQFHVTIAVPDGFSTETASALAPNVRSVVRRALPQLFTPPGQIVAAILPDFVDVTVTPEGR
jgi:hypothetical protein